MRTVVALLLLFTLTGAASAPVYPVTHAATLRLGFEDGTCSGTAIAQRRVLTAEHCIEGGALVKINGRPAHVTGQPVLDGNDHAILTVDVTFKQWARIGGGMYQAQALHWWGNPAGLDDLFRRGYVSGTTEGWMLIVGMGYKGDSGAALFDQHGLIVGIVSTLWVEGSFQLLGAKPLAFTVEQWKA